MLVFGPWLGFTLNVSANLIGASLSFYIGRWCLRHWVQTTSRVSPSFQLALRVFDRDEYKAVLTIRFLYIPTGVKNYLLGAIPHARFSVYFICTLIATVVFSSLLAIVGSMAVNIVDIVRSPSTAEWVAIGIGLAAAIGLVILIYVSSRSLVLDIQKDDDAEALFNAPSIIVENHAN